MKLVVATEVMVNACKECGCQCRLCDTNSLDLHHDIELLSAQVTEYKQTIQTLKSELLQKQREIDLLSGKNDTENQQLREKHERLEASYQCMERVNHDLEDKILCLVQANEAERLATIEIHSNLHARIKAANLQIEKLLSEQKYWADNCKLAVDLFRDQQFSSKTVHQDLWRLEDELHDFEASHTEAGEVKSSNVLAISTFPPCAIIVNSPKPPRKACQKARAMLPRNYSDSRLAQLGSRATGLQLCDRCKGFKWTCSTATQTDPFTMSLDYHRNQYSRIFDI